MQTTVDTLPKSTVRIRVVVETAELQADLQAAVRELSTSRAFPGFRPGKAPYEVVAKQVGEMAIWQEAAEHAVTRTFAAIVRERKFQTLGQPEVKIEQLAPGNPLIYSATVAVLPDVQLGSYDGLSATKTVKPVTDEDVDKAVEELRRLLAVEKPVDRPSQKGDRVEIDVDVFVDKVPIEGGKSRRHPAVLGEATFIPGFEEQVIGMTKGQTKEFALTFPSDYHAKHLAGKLAEFRITLQKVAEAELPALDDAFAKRVANVETVAALRDQLRRNLDAERQEEAERAYEGGLLDELAKRTTLGELPDVLLENELERMVAELKHDVEHRGMKFDDYLKTMKRDEVGLRRELRTPAERRVKTALIIRTIVLREHLTADEHDVDAELATIRQRAPDDPAQRQHLETPDFRDYVRSVLVNRQAVQFLKQRQGAPKP